LYPSPVANGDDWFQVGEPVTVNVVPVVEESTKEAPDTVFIKSTVFVIAVKGIVDGVNAAE
jgi:hypothetical protein